MSAYNFRAASTLRADVSFQAATISKPTGTAEGDLLVLALWTTTPAGSISLPAGFTQIRIYNVGTADQMVSAYKVAGSSEPSSYSIGVTENVVAVLAAYDGSFTGTVVVSSVDGRQFNTSNTLALPAVTTTALNSILVAVFGSSLSATWTPPAGMTERAEVPHSGVVFHSLALSDQHFTPAGSTGTRTGTRSNTDGMHLMGHLLAFSVVNVAPNAPTLVTPIAGTIDLGLTQRFDWDFSDADAGDTQSKYDLRYRIVGAASWTILTGTTANTYRDIAAGTFAAGDYEWQVRTYDALGEVGPYSASSFFTAASPPAGPSITEPINGATIATAAATVAWSVPDQDSYQLRRVADNAGVADTATVYYDTGTVASTIRALSVTFETNNRWEHVQVRVFHDGLWSPWASARVLVDYTEPMVPTATVTAYNDDGRILVDLTNPTPTGGEPVVVSNDIYRSSSEGEIRVAIDIEPNGAFNDYAVASGVDYSYFIRAWGDNGTFVDTELIGGTTEEIFTDEYGGYE